MNDHNPTCYRIVRCVRDSDRRPRIVRRGLTLAEAQAHCQDPETSSSTCTASAATARTRRIGPWFDAFEQAT